MAAGNDLAQMGDQLMEQQTLGIQPSLFGLQATPDPDKIQALLDKVRQQQYYERATAPTQSSDPYAYLHDAGNLNAVTLGQNLGNIANTALKPPAQPQPPSPMQQAILQGRAMYQQLLANGVPEEDARIATANKLTQAGVPNADQVLQAANASKTEAELKRSNTAKDFAQAAMDTKEIDNKSSEIGSRNFKTVYKDPQGLFELQQNDNGKIERVELKPPASVTQAAASDPTSVKFAADYFRANGTMPPGSTRSPLFSMNVLKQAAQDAEATGDTVGSIRARQAFKTASQGALTQGAKTLQAYEQSYSTLEKNLSPLSDANEKRLSTDATLANKVINDFNTKGKPNADTIRYVNWLNTAVEEYGKLRSGSLGNAGLTNAAREAAKEQVNQAFDKGGIRAVIDIMRQEGANAVQAKREEQAQILSGLGETAPGNKPGTAPVTTSTFGGAPQGAAPTPAAPAAGKTLVYNPKTGGFN